MKYLVITKSFINLTNVIEFDTKFDAVEAAKSYISRGFAVRIATEMPMNVAITFDEGESNG